MVVDEAPASFGFSGEIIALATQDAFDSLDTPPRRICSSHVPNPFSPVLENEMMPSTAKIVREVREMLRG
jgi:pyruvate/2-oxoglutarate/acetoin dehydrogenase E1 component